MLGLMFAVAVVDQIDAPGALVEIGGERVEMIDARCLPRRAGEGDRVWVRLRPVEDCPVRGLWVERR